MKSQLPEDDFGQQRDRDPEYNPKPCDRCSKYSRHVYDRASLSQKRLLCRECVAIVEEERHAQQTSDVLQTIKEENPEQ